MTTVPDPATDGRPSGPPADAHPIEVSHPVVLFDGHCNLCSGAVNFIIKHDSRDRFRFASLQSPAGLDLLHRHGLPTDVNTIVVIDGGQTFTQSTAVLRIAADLDAPWPLAALATVIPRHLRDDAYAFIARHRLHWFGRKETCRMPTEQDRARFLGDPA